MHLVSLIILGQATVAAIATISSGKVYMREPNDRGPTTWQSGLKCLQAIGSFYLSPREYSKVNFRSMNMVITHSKNMTTPAAQIEERYLSLKNEAISQKSKNKLLSVYATRIVSDAVPLPKQKFSSDFIIYTDAYVIVVDDVERLYKLFEQYMIKMQTWNPGARFLILYNHVDDRNRSLAVANEIFELLLHQYYVNTVSLLYAINNTAYHYYILDNFNPTACRQVKASKIATCDMGKIPNEWVVGSNINKILRKDSLEKCTFYVCAAVAAPFIESDCVNGIELHLIDVMRQKLGFELNITCGQYKRGVRIAENETWTELLGRVDDRICDFTLGGFYSDDEVREDFWVTDSYLFNSHTWFIATAAPRPPWKALFTIFQANMWLCIAIVLLITWFFWLTFGSMLPEMEAHKSPALTAINSWGVTLGASVAERPECQTSRIFFIGLCLYSMNVTGIYTSKLIAVFANPGYEHQISTIDEVIRRDIPFGGPAENRDWFENADDMEIYTRYNDSDNFMPRTRNLRAVAAGERVILANRMYMLRNRNTDQLFGFPENVFSSPVEIIAKRGFPFLSRFNALIRQMKDSGLFSKIDRDFRYHYTVLMNIRQLRADYQEAVIVLTIHHLEGAFAFLIFGILLSIVAFAGEQINYRYFHPWLCKKCNWKWETEEEEDHHHRRRKDDDGARKQRQWQQTQRTPTTTMTMTTTTTTSDEGRPVINVRMEQIRFTPLKRRRIQLN